MKLRKGGESGGHLTEMGSFELDSDFLAQIAELVWVVCKCYFSVSQSMSHLAHTFQPQDTWLLHGLGRRIWIPWKWDEDICIYVILDILHRMKYMQQSQFTTQYMGVYRFSFFTWLFNLMSRDEYSWCSHKVTSIPLERCKSHSPLGPWAFLWRTDFRGSLQLSTATFSWLRCQCSLPMVFWTPTGHSHFHKGRRRIQGTGKIKAASKPLTQ